MAVQVVLLTFILNALFFRPVGRAVEEREGYIASWSVEDAEGGVGKTWLAITLAQALSRMGRRVLLFDGDLGLKLRRATGNG
jgi:hypothetical protein